MDSLELTVTDTVRVPHYKKNHLHSSNEENSQNKQADLNGNFFGVSAVTIKSLHKLALHKIPLAVRLCA